MRYLSLIGMALSGLALADGLPLPSQLATGSAQLSVQLSIADPCQNTLHALDDICADSTALQLTESTESLPAWDSAAPLVTDQPAAQYIVRTIDFY